MPMNSPDTMMMMSESTPLKYTSRITRRKREKLVPDEASTRPKKRAMEPRRQMPLITFLPRRERGFLTSSTGGPRGKAHVHFVALRGIVERHGTVGLAVHELAHVRQLRAADLLGGSAIRSRRGSR